jgi:hypothetical protein
MSYHHSADEENRLEENTHFRPRKCMVSFALYSNLHPVLSTELSMDKGPVTPRSFLDAVGKIRARSGTVLSFDQLIIVIMLSM